MYLYRSALILFLALMLITAGAQATTFKIATIAPDGTTWMKEMRAGAKQISEKTKGA